MVAFEAGLTFETPRKKLFEEDRKIRSSTDDLEACCHAHLLHSLHFGLYWPCFNIINKLKSTKQTTKKLKIILNDISQSVERFPKIARVILHSSGICCAIKTGEELSFAMPRKIPVQLRRWWNFNKSDCITFRAKNNALIYRPWFARRFGVRALIKLDQSRPGRSGRIQIFFFLGSKNGDQEKLRDMRVVPALFQFRIKINYFLSIAHLTACSLSPQWWVSNSAEVSDALIICV